LIASLLAVATLACTGAQGSKSGGSTTTARIDRVLAGLRPGMIIQGDSSPRWTLAERMQHYHVPGVSITVVDSGRIVYAKGFGLKDAGSPDSVTPTTRFQAASISKPTFALAVMRLVEAGTLNLDQNVNERLTSWHLPDNKFTAHEKVTLRRILSHSAGLTVHGFPGYEAGTPIPTLPQVLDGAKPANTAPVRVDTTPGAISRYSGGGTTIALQLVEDVTKEPFPAFMQRMVLTPAGMTHSTYEQPLPASLASEAATGHDTAGHAIPGKYHTYPEMSAAGLWTTPSDLVTLGLVLDSTYAGKDSSIVKPATLAQMFTVQKAPFGIGYQLQGTGHDLEYGHSGGNEGFISDFVMFPGRGQGVAIMTNANEGGNVVAEIEASLAAEYGWPDRQQKVRTFVTVDPKVLTAVAGHYRVKVEKNPTDVTVTADSGKLFVAAPPFIQRVQLMAESDSSFFTRDGGMPVVFHRTAAGRVDAITLAREVKGQRVR
jgi:CubicO group peptidase (beta-lactamase class C family)